VLRLEAGKVDGNVYENHQLGFAYELPKGWHLKSSAAVMPAIERERERGLGEPAVGKNERLMRDACERTLISAWRTPPEPGRGDIVYEDFGEVTLFATPLACFPNVKFPNVLDEKEPLRDFLVAYGESHPIMRDMKGARAFAHDGRTFIVMQGVVAYQEPGDALSRRVSVALALTRQRDYLLAFFFAAPHDAELRELMKVKAAFDPEPAVQQATVAAPASAGAERQEHPGGSAVDAVSAPPQPAAEPVAASEDSSAPAASAPSEAASTPPADAAPARPTLLKPGETMDEQQMKGASIPKNRSH
jgi:hypothetical protein